jgi:hypothetical protein
VGDGDVGTGRPVELAATAGQLLQFFEKSGCQGTTRCPGREAARGLLGTAVWGNDGTMSWPPDEWATATILNLSPGDRESEHCCWAAKLSFEDVRSQTEIGNQVNAAAMRIVRRLTGQLTKSRGNAKY